MFQTEFSHPRQGTPAVGPRGAALAGVVPLVWEEHCTECAFPTCYTTCSLYRPRRDGHCARFADGIAVTTRPDAPAGQTADVTFGRWAKLEARLPPQPRRATPQAVRRFAVAERLTARLVGQTPAALAPRLMIRYALGRERAVQRLGRADAAGPDALVVDVWSHHTEPFQLTVETDGASGIRRTGVTLSPGANAVQIPCAELGLVPASWPERLFLYPENDLEVRLTFQCLELAWTDTAPGSAAVAPPARVRVDAPSPKVKVLVWDLDNTLWHGTLVEDGAEALVLRQGVPELLDDLDRRGVLLSVASKNDAAPALTVLARFGLAEMFLVPQISWEPKSEALRRIAAQLDLGLDSLAFVDDSAFERGEVADALGALRIYEPEDLPGLLDRPEFDVPATAEAAGRRAMYRTEAMRRAELHAAGTDYDAFLRSCALGVRVFRPSTSAELTRCVELINRTNQLNLTTRRYTPAEFDAVLADPTREILGLEAWDRFGKYGIVGVGIVEHAANGPLLTDFVTSCRVARKAIEQAWFEWLRTHVAESGTFATLRALFLPTARNHLLRDVLNEVGFVDLAEPDDAGTWLGLPLDTPVARSDIASVTDDVG